MVVVKFLLLLEGRVYLADFTVIFNSYSFSVNSYFSFLFFPFFFFFSSYLSDRWTAYGLFLKKVKIKK